MMPLSLGASVFFLFLGVPSPDSEFLIKDLTAPQRVDYLIVAGEPFVHSLDELAAHRKKQGHAVGIVGYPAVKERFGGVREFLAHAVEKWTPPAPRFLLLVGDVETVPTMVCQGGVISLGNLDGKLATDFDYACPLKEFDPILHVGRFPCDTPDELRTMIRKTIDYETKLQPGLWQKKIHFVTGMAGFGAEMDAMIEKLFAQVVGTTVPAPYDVELAYANPRSIYCPYPPRFNEHALRMMNEGGLLYVFVGHGSPDSVQDLLWKEKVYPIFTSKDAPKIDVRAGLPIMVVIACSTGHFDRQEDCVGEVYFKREGGPVAFLGGSRVTDPYGNALLGVELAEEMFGEAKTLGEILTKVKKDLLAHEATKLKKQIDLMSTLGGQKKEGLELIRRDTVRHYNLFGDPALVVRRPAPAIKVSLENTRLLIEADVAETLVTLECERDKHLEVLEKKILDSDPDFEKKVEERFRKANQKVIRSWTVKLSDGKGVQEVDLPKEAGRYWFKVYATGLIGALEYTVSKGD